jgi:alpha-L-rhamnosidase
MIHSRVLFSFLKSPLVLVSLFLLTGSLGLAAPAPSSHPAIVSDEYIWQLNQRPTPHCHASTIVEAADGTLLAAWFSRPEPNVTDYKAADAGIWFARFNEGRWSQPAEVANGLQPDGKIFPCWNPVLFQPKTGSLLLFFKVGPSCDIWWGELMRSCPASVEILQMPA